MVSPVHPARQQGAKRKGSCSCLSPEAGAILLPMPTSVRFGGACVTGSNRVGFGTTRVLLYICWPVALPVDEPLVARDRVTVGAENQP